MGMLTELRRRGRFVIGPLLGLSAFAYFAYHGIQGDRGLIAYLQLERQIETAEQRLADLAAERAQWEHRTKLLRRDQLDRDMLDERVRAMLNLVGPDEIVVMVDPEPR